MSGRCLGLLCLALSFACGPAAPDDADGGTEGDTVGDGDGDGGDGDGDGGDGDGDGDGGDGDGDGGDGFEQLCETGCAHVLDCAPDEFAALYADVPECVDACLGLWGGCVAEGTVYIECTIGLDCPGVVTLLSEGPAQTACGPGFEAAQAACMNP